MSETVTIDSYTVTIYGTVAARDRYLLTSRRFRAAWSALDADTRNMVSVDVANNLNLRPWKGTKTSEVQPLAWPRVDATNQDGDAIDSNVTPALIEEASYVFAGLLALDPSALGNGQAPRQLQSLREGPVSASWYFQPPAVAVDGSGIPSLAEIDAMIAGFLGDSEGASLGSLMAGTASGTDGESAFTDDKRYTIQDGVS